MSGPISPGPSFYSQPHATLPCDPANRFDTVRGVSSVSMNARLTLEEILDQARLLSEEEQQRQVADLQANAGGRTPSDDRRRATMRRWLARAGTGHADVEDISSNKNRYLAEIYATKP
jgi:hypothetical protein